jgi:prepilin-type N-terminal cleavage/methylation domain-containing protein
MRRGFSLVELLVVIGIIAVLIGILVPTIAKVRQSAYIASTTALIQKLSAAIEQYRQNFNSYPGPIGQNDLSNVSGTYTLPVSTGGTITNAFPSNTVAQSPTAAVSSFVSITGTNNLVLGLLGGLTRTSAGVIQFDPAAVGKGPQSLNPAQPASYPALIDTANISTGQYRYDNTITLNDCVIPTFVDAFPDAMPILYLRARPAVGGVAGYNFASGQYDLRDVIGYTSVAFGGAATLSSRTANTKPGSGEALRHGLSWIDTTGKATTGKADPSPAVYYYPYEFASYIRNPNLPSTPRAKDGFILIAAGKDRVYGTDDDIASFGQVK